MNWSLDLEWLNIRAKIKRFVVNCVSVISEYKCVHGLLSIITSISNSTVCISSYLSLLFCKSFFNKSFTLWIRRLGCSTYNTMTNGQHAAFIYGKHLPNRLLVGCFPAKATAKNLSKDFEKVVTDLTNAPSLPTIRSPASWRMFLPKKLISQKKSLRSKTTRKLQ